MGGNVGRGQGRGGHHRQQQHQQRDNSGITTKIDGDVILFGY
jgi:hypothetical protein